MKYFQMKAIDAFLFNLRHIMYVKDLKQQDLADLLGVSKQNINNMLNNSESVTLKTVAKLAKVLKIEETDLFDPNFQDRYKKKTK